MALLGDNQLETGSFQQNGGISYYPEIPFMMENCSIRHNIIFDANADTSINMNIYKDAMNIVQMHLNPGIDSMPLAKQYLNQQCLQRISLARAICSKRLNYKHSQS